MPQLLLGDETPAVSKRPKVALVLSGGGARGITHIGVMKVLEELKVPVDMIVGTSMESIAGGLYAIGNSPEELEEMVLQTPWDTLFLDTTSRSDLPYREKPDEKNYFLIIGDDHKEGIILPKGLIPTKKLEFRLRAWTAEAPENFDRFQIPFRAVATDIATGSTVALSRGDLARSLRASMAVPGAFEPVEIDGKMLVDGGVSDQLPVDIAKQMGADVIIAVNIGTPLKPANELKSVLDISDQLTNILTNQSVFDAEKLLTENDVLITPDLEGFTSMDFSRGTQEIEIGINAALAVKDKLSRYSVSDAEFSEYLKKQRRKEDTQYEFIEVKTSFGNFHEKIKKSDDIQKIIDNRLIGRLFFRNMEFEAVDFTVIEKDGKKGLLLKAESKGKKPDQLKFGMEIEDDVEGDANYNVLIGYTMNSINRLGADWKNEVQIGQTNRIFSEF